MGYTPPKVVGEGYGAYSVPQRLNDGTVALLYEATSNTVIRLLILDLGDIGGGVSILTRQATHRPRCEYRRCGSTGKRVRPAGTEWLGCVSLPTP